MKKWLIPLVLLAACTENEPVVVSRGADGTITMAFETPKCIDSASIETEDGRQLWFAGLNNRAHCLDRISTNYRGPIYTIIKKGYWGPGAQCLHISLNAIGVMGRRQFCF